VTSDYLLLILQFAGLNAV